MLVKAMRKIERFGESKTFRFMQSLKDLSQRIQQVHKTNYFQLEVLSTKKGSVSKASVSKELISKESVSKESILKVSKAIILGFLCDYL